MSLLELRIPATALGLAVLLTPAQAQLAGGGGRQNRAVRDLIPFAIETAPGLHDLWLVEASSGLATLAAGELRFRPLGLVGRAPYESLRADRPCQAALDGAPPHVRLPEGAGGGAALYHLERAGRSELLLVQRELEPRGLLTVADAAGLAGLLPSVHVSGDGRLALVASSLQAGGEAILVDLTGRSAPIVLNRGGGALSIEAASLRVSTRAAWFAAGDVLYRATPPKWRAVPVDLGLSAEESLVAESVLAEGGAHLAVMVQAEDTLRRILLVPASGPAVEVTPGPGAYDLPGLDDPLGPFLALAPDGSRVAYRARELSEELYVREVGGELFHITQAPVFPAYIDNVGVFSFFSPVKLLYLAGDRQLSLIDEDELIGAADVYVSEFDGLGGVSCYNLTRTSGQLWPPFDQPGQMIVAEARLDPRGDRVLVIEEVAGAESALTCYRLDGKGYAHGQPNREVLVSPIDDEPDLVAVAHHVLILSESEPDNDEDEESQVHLLQPAGSGPAVIDLLASFPEGSVLERVARAPGRGAFVARSPQGQDTPYFVGLVPAVAIAATPPRWSVDVSPSIALSRNGRLLLGVKAGGQPMQFLRFDAPGTWVTLGLPSGMGFPLTQ